MERLRKGTTGCCLEGREFGIKNQLSNKNKTMKILHNAEIESNAHHKPQYLNSALKAGHEMDTNSRYKLS
jgi:hypothetical protein